MSVSVIVAAYNAAPFVHRAIRSALNQTRPPLEVVVVDDASSDETAFRVDELSRKDPRIRLVRLEMNLGPGGARNAGIDTARGEWVAILDADDAFGPKRLQALTAFAAEHRADIVADNLEVYDFVADRVVGTAVRSDQPTIIGPREYLERCRGGDAKSIDWGILHPMFRRTFLESSGVRYPGLRHAEDFAFVLELMLHGARFAYLPEAHYRYTQRFGMVSHVASNMTRTRIDYGAVRAWTLGLQEDPRIARDPNLKRFARERAEALWRIEQSHALRALLHERAYVEVLLHVARRPRAALELGVRLARSVRHHARRLGPGPHLSGGQKP
jgi:succinoglycan biosynthesis protein ExoO